MRVAMKVDLMAVQRVDVMVVTMVLMTAEQWAELMAV